MVNTLLLKMLKKEWAKMEQIKIRDDFIKLGQALKLAGMVETGLDAKLFIQDGDVKVNGEVELRRGRKLYKGDQIEFDGEEFVIA